MKTRVFFLLAAMGLLASCAQEIEISEPTPETNVKTYITVGLDSDTKTYLGDKDANNKRKVYWSNGDQIRINNSESDELTGLADNTSAATFAFDVAPTAPYNVLYPAGIYSDATHVTLPAIQTYKEGGIADNMFPMAGCSDSDDITLSHLCAILKISVERAEGVDADTDNLASVSFKGRNGEQVSGSFEINYSTPALTPADGTGADLEVRVVKTLTTNTETTCDYYLVVPARTYSNGFDVLVQDVKGDLMTKSKTTSVDLVAGKLYNLDAFEFEPTGTATGIEISSAEELIDFARRYNAKEFADYGSSLVATITNNIAFVDSDDPDVPGSYAAFNATGGIGTSGDTNRFDGIFDGGSKNSYTISGLKSTVPMFNGTTSASIIKNLTLDNTCSFTFTNPNSGNFEKGAIVGYHRGTLDKVSVAASVSLVGGEISTLTSLGGLVGRIVVGSIENNSSFSGDIVVPDNYSAADQKIYIGGLTGWISNEKGNVTESDFAGTIDNQGKMIASSESDEMKNNPQLIIGGIVGLNSGTVSSCTTANHATGVTVTLNDGSDHDYTGTIVTHSTNAYHYAIAGIVGRNDNTVSNCTNSANVVNIFSAERGSGGNMNGRYLEVGGLVGYNASGASISGGTNSGSIIDRANPKIQYVGGVVGRNVGGTVSGCDNKSTGSIAVGTSHTTPYGARMLNVGGIIASNEGGSLSSIHNAASITVSRIENTTGIFTRIGGVIGSSTSAVDGSANGGTITNSGAIAQSSGIGKCSTPTDENDYGLFLGGIIGYTTAGVKNVSNSGTVTYTCTNKGTNTSGKTDGGAQYVYLGGVAGKIKATSSVDVDACSNTENVTFTATASYSSSPANDNQSQGVLYAYNYLGGIVGYAINAEFKGNCTNSGVIKGGDKTANRNTGNTFWVGGIVGYLTGSSSIANCSLVGSGQAYNDHFSNRGETTYDSPASGGIAGQVVGEDGVVITISNCSVENTATVTARRGACGGIVGMAQYVSISSCTVPVGFSGSGYVYGGIAAQAQNTTISNCSYSGSTIQSSQLKFGGGIIGFLDTSSVVDGCSSSATVVNKNGTAVTTTGGISGKSVTGSTIQNCHYTTTIGKICGDSNFSGDGNVADL